MKTYADGDKVRVVDPDGAKWNGSIACKSVLWANWYVVRPERAGRRTLGKAGVYTVHANEMTPQ